MHPWVKMLITASRNVKKNTTCTGKRPGVQRLDCWVRNQSMTAAIWLQTRLEASSWTCSISLAEEICVRGWVHSEWPSNQWRWARLLAWTSQTLRSVPSVLKELVYQLETRQSLEKSYNFAPPPMKVNGPALADLVAGLPHDDHQLKVQRQTTTPFLFAWWNSLIISIV